MIVSDSFGSNTSLPAVLTIDGATDIGKTLTAASNPLVVQGEGAPSLTIVATNNTVMISWPSNFTDWTLQENAGLDSASWVTASETVTEEGTSKFILVSPSAGNRFYRLFRPGAP